MGPAKSDKAVAQEAGRKAVRLFVDRKWNCAEAVCLAVGEATGKAVPAHLATAFGGGMGDMEGTCGCVTGAILAMAPRIGRSETDREAEADAARTAAEFRRRFAEEFGSTKCRELNGGETDDARLRRLCSRYVRFAAGKAVEVICKARVR